MSNIEPGKPRVLIGSAVHESKGYILDEFLAHLKQLDYEPLDIYLCDNSRTDSYSKRIAEALKKINLKAKIEKDVWCSDFRGRMVTSHNMLREEALRGNYDYLLILDQDILIEPDLINKLIFHKKDVVSCIYKLDMGELGMVNCCWHRRKDLVNGRFRAKWIKDEEINKGLIQWDGGFPTGMVLLSHNVLEDTIFRHAGFLQDSIFWEDVRDAGYEVFLDTNIMGDHRPSDWERLRSQDVEDFKKARKCDEQGISDKFYFRPMVPKKW
jgi:glycosyltransferase involved in cell wall biosynthesis